MVAQEVPASVRVVPAVRLRGRLPLRAERTNWREKVVRLWLILFIYFVAGMVVGGTFTWVVVR